MKKELLLFCTSNYFNINNELVNNKYNLFNEVKMLNENDLDDYIKSIVESNIEKYGHDGNGWPNRGYGYWIWKPYIILQELNNLNDGDILVHLDMHCHLDIIKDKFNDIINELQHQSIILGNVGFNDLIYTTTKLRKHVENKLNYKFSKNELLQCQYESGIQFIKNDEFSRKFIKTWFDLMLTGLDYVSDMYNNDKDNHKTFIENRHDQSVISLLYKYYKLKHIDYLNWDNLNINK
jgi:hypothetical protein